MNRANKKHQTHKPIQMLGKDIRLNLNPDISESIKAYQDLVKAEKQAKESIERNRHILEQD